MLFMVNIDSTSSKLSYLPDEYNLEKFWSLLNVFTDCTLHVVRNDVASQTTYYNLESFPNDNFATLQSTKPLVAILDKINESILSVTMEYQELSLLFNITFPSKNRIICSVELVLPFQNNASNVHSLSFNFLYKNTENYKFSAPNFVLIPINVQVVDISNLHLTLSFFTKATILTLLIPKSEVYFACFSYSETNEYEKWIRYPVYRVLASNMKLTEEIKFVKSLAKLKFTITKHTFQRKNFIVAEKLIFEKFRSPALKLNVFKNVDDKNYQKKLIREMLNCTFDYNNDNNNNNKVCAHIFSFSIGYYAGYEKSVFYSPHGNEFFGMRYSYFYTSNIYRNIYALLSPFPLEGWLIVILSCYLVGLVLWLTTINSHPFFWLSTVILEQNSSKWGHVNPANMFIIGLWLYVCHVFRNAYTSNLYSYMTLELEPYDLPVTFEDIVNWDSVTIFSNYEIIQVIKEYEYNFDCHPNLVHTKMYKLTQVVLQKTLNIWIQFVQTQYLMRILNRSIANYLTCNLNDLVGFRSESCRYLEKFAYLTRSGPVDNPDTHLYSAGKLILLMSNTNVKIVDYNGVNLYPSRKQFFSMTDHVFRLEFEKYLALISQSGIDDLLKKYFTEVKMRDIFFKFDIHHYHRIGNKSMSRYIPLWIRNGCFTFFSIARCDVNFEKHLEVPVKLIDLLGVWIVIFGSLVGSVLLFTYERI